MNFRFNNDKSISLMLIELDFSNLLKSRVWEGAYSVPPKLQKQPPEEFYKKSGS